MDAISYSDVIKKFRRRYKQEEALKPVLIRMKDEIESFKAVNVCLSLGTGYGQFDIMFIKLCFPNLKKLIVVEREHSCVEELKLNLKDAFGDEIEVEIYEMSIENFLDYFEPSKHGKIDIILAIHVLYYLTPTTRFKLFTLAFDKWLEAQVGKLIFANATEENSISKLHEILDNHMNKFQHSGIIKSEIDSMGLSITRVNSYECEFNLKYDKDLFDMFSFNHLNNVSESIFKEAVKTVAPEDKGRDVCEICMVEGRV